MANKSWIGGSGSQSWATSGNWSPANAPVTGDAVYILAGASTIDSGLAQSAVQLALLLSGPNFTGSVGTSATPLAIGADTHNLDGTNLSGRFNWDAGSSATVGAIQNTPFNTTDSGLQWIRIKGADITTTVYGGTVGIATNAVGDTAGLTSLSVATATGQVSTINVTLASGVTITAVKQYVPGSTITANSACPSLIQTAGIFIHQGTGALGATALTIGGTVYPNSSGAVSTNPPIVLATGRLDFSTSPTARTVTNAVNLYAGATLVADKTYITLSAGFKTVQCGIGDVTVNVGVNRTFTVA